jgi:hypothetical protein
MTDNASEITCTSSEGEKIGLKVRYNQDRRYQINRVNKITRLITRLICKKFNTIIISDDFCSIPNIEKDFIGRLIVKTMDLLDITSVESPRNGVQVITGGSNSDCISTAKSFKDHVHLRKDIYEMVFKKITTEPKWFDAIIDGIIFSLKNYNKKHPICYNYILKTYFGKLVTDYNIPSSNSIVSKIISKGDEVDTKSTSITPSLSNFKALLRIETTKYLGGETNDFIGSDNIEGDITTLFVKIFAELSKRFEDNKDKILKSVVHNIFDVNKMQLKDKQILKKSLKINIDDIVLSSPSQTKANGGMPPIDPRGMPSIDPKQMTQEVIAGVVGAAKTVLEQRTIDSLPLQSVESRMKGIINDKYDAEGEAIVKFIEENFEAIFEKHLKERQNGILTVLTTFDNKHELIAIIHDGLEKEYKYYEKSRINKARKYLKGKVGTDSFIKKLMEEKLKETNESIIGFIDDCFKSSRENLQKLKIGGNYYIEYDVSDTMTLSKRKGEIESLFGNTTVKPKDVKREFVVFVGYENNILPIKNKSVTENPYAKFALFRKICDKNRLLKFRGIDNSQFKLIGSFKKDQEYKVVLDSGKPSVCLHDILTVEVDKVIYYGIVHSIIGTNVTTYVYDKDGKLSRYEKIEKYYNTVELKCKLDDIGIVKTEQTKPIIKLVWGLKQNVYNGDFYNDDKKDLLTFIDISPFSESKLSEFKSYFLTTDYQKKLDFYRILFGDKVEDILNGLGSNESIMHRNTLYNAYLKNVYSNKDCYLFFQRKSDGKLCYFKADHFFIDDSDKKDKFFTFTAPDGSSFEISTTRGGTRKKSKKGKKGTLKNVKN